MKILVIGSMFPQSADESLVSGVVKNAFNHARSLAASGVDVTVITDGTHTGAWKYAGMQVYGVGAGVLYGVVKAAYLDLKITWRLFRLGRKKFDVIHVHTGNVVLLMLFKKLGIVRSVIVYTAHGTTTPELLASRRGQVRFKERLVHLNGRVQEVLDRLMWRMADHLISVSAYQVAEMKSIYNTPAEVISQVYNGYDESLYTLNEVAGQARRAVLGINNTDPVILYVGRATKKKGVDLLLNAAPALVAAYPNLRLVCVLGDHGKGFDAPYVQSLQNARDKSTVESHISFCSNVAEAELPSYYQMASVAVFPSQGYESLPTVIFEALACGAPVIAPDAWGIPEVLSEYRLPETAFGDEQLVQAVSIALEAPFNPTEQAKSVRSYQWSTLAKQYIDIYENLIS